MAQKPKITPKIYKNTRKMTKNSLKSRKNWGDTELRQNRGRKGQNLTKITYFDEKHAADRAYMKAWRRYRRFKIDRNRYYSLLELQGGVCPICGAEYDDGVWVPVRDPDTLVVKGIICPTCGKGLLNFKHRADLLERAKVFIEFKPDEEYPYIQWQEWMALPDDFNTTDYQSAV